MKNLARDLLRAVADGGDVSIARVHDFARAVIEAPRFRVAQELLQDAPSEFAVRKALELASIVLIADDSAAERVAEGTGVIASGASKKTTPTSDQVLPVISRPAIRAN